MREEDYSNSHGVYHDIADFKETQLEMEHLINSIPGGIASYKVEHNIFIPVFFSEGVMNLSGHTRAEYEQLIRHNALDIIYEQDRERVGAAAQTALVSGEVLDVSYRMRHKNGSLIWIHLNGRRMGPLSEVMKFYAVFTGMSAETRMYESIANDTADEIYVIDKNNYDLLYANEQGNNNAEEPKCVGKKCYAVLHKKNAPCEFCTLNNHELEGKEHEMVVEGSNHFYRTRFRETEWNGIPAYVKYVRDITEEVMARREKEELETYFETIVKNLPEGVVVASRDKNGSMVPELISDGFAEMTEMPLERAWELCREDTMRGIHPDDKNYVMEQMKEHMGCDEKDWEIVYRILKGDGSYLWVKNTLSMICDGSQTRGLYAVYHDITKEREEQEKLRKQYKEQIMQHYHTTDPNVLVMGHSNITRNRVLEIIDHTDSDLLKNLGFVREDFLKGFSQMIIDESQRQEFLHTYLNKPLMKAFGRKDTEKVLECFVQMPKEKKGRYVQFKVNLVETPDTGDITGILTVRDITDQTVSDKILYQLSVNNYDFVIDLDLGQDTFKVLTGGKKLGNMPAAGKNSTWKSHMFKTSVLPKDQEQYMKNLNSDEICRRLKEEGSYTFSYSMVDENGEIHIKNMTVSEVDIRIGRVCLIRTDITESVREQQGLLNVIAYTFELLGFLNIPNNSFTMYTRQTVLENLPPYVIENQNNSAIYFADQFGAEENKEEFLLENMVNKLKEKPAGYDFVFPYRAEDGMHYKQINVLWGDENHKTVCLVRADVTEMLAAERETKKTLEEALAFAKRANRAKSDFLSAMSHDIRTPMNAIMGMTTLAEAHLDDKARTAGYLKKISASSKHLQSLINDVLDMSKIEHSKISLNCMRISFTELLEQLLAIMEPQTKDAGIQFNVHKGRVSHGYFIGDPLRINQILINILSNAIKFTQEGGTVDFFIEEMASEKGRGWIRYKFTVSDNGAGMTDEFLNHIYEPFSRSYSTAHTEGTGLGLSITKGLVELMDGEISVKSEVDKGTMFCVELECEEVQELPEIDGIETVCDSCAQEKFFQGYRFLAAEDNEVNAEILCEILGMYGAECIVKTDGVQVVQEFENTEEGTYDAILMDIQMPKMNGYEAARAIRQMNRRDAEKIPIVAMTANAFSDDIQTALKSGMNVHVAKPIDIAILKAALNKVLRGM